MKRVLPKIGIDVFLGWLFIIIIINSFLGERIAYGQGYPEIIVQLGDKVSSVAVSPDIRYVLSGGQKMKLWDFSTGREIRSFSGHSERVTSVAFSPDGRFVLSGSDDKTLRQYNVNTSREIRTFNGHSERVNSVAFSPDGRFVLSGSWDNTMKLWDIATGNVIRTFSGHSRAVSSVIFSPDGRFVLSGSSDHTLKFWDVATGIEVRTFRGHSNDVTSVSFSSDGRYVLSGSFDNTVKLWDASSGKELKTFKGHSLRTIKLPQGQVTLGIIRSVALSPDGKYALSGGTDMTVKLWNVSTGKEINTFKGHSYDVNSCVFTPDGSYVLSGSFDGTIRIWDVSTGREVKQLTGNISGVTSVALSPDGRNILSGSGDKTLRLWEVSTGKLTRIFKGHLAEVLSVAFSPDGRYAISGSYDRTVKLWDVSTGEEVRTFHLGDSVNYVMFTLDNKYIFAFSNGLDYMVSFKIFDTSTGIEIKSVKNLFRIDQASGVSPNGKFIITAPGIYREGSIKLWDVETGKILKTFDASVGNIINVRFSPDSEYAILRSWDGDVTLWDVSKGKIIRSFDRISRDFGGTSFSPDGNSIFLYEQNNKTFKQFIVATGKEIRTIKHSLDVSSVGLSPDSKYFIAGCNNGIMSLWDDSTGKEIVQFIPFINDEWITITAEGYFTASKNGPSHLNVRVGNRVFGVDQFYDVFYRPDIVEAKLKGEDTAALVSSHLEEALQNPPPNVEFVNIPSESADKKVIIKYRITSTGGGIGEVRLFQNGKLIKSDGFYRQSKMVTTKQAALVAYNTRAIKEELRGITFVARQDNKPSLIESNPKGEIYEATIMVDAIFGENDISLAAFNKSNTVQSILKTATFKSTIKPEEPHLYIFSVGIDEYKSTKDNLKYAVKDAESISTKIKEQSLTQYKPENIHVVTLKNIEATKTNIIGKLLELSQLISPSDIFVLFIASHGVFQSGLYSIVTQDYDGNLNSRNLINSVDIMEISKNMKALTQIFILDTCHAGGLDNFVSGLYDARMTVMARNMGLHMFASANSIQEALDGYKGENGMFTYTLIEGLNNNRSTDANRDGKVSIYELGSYAKDRTVRLSKETGHAQTPLINNFGKDISVYVIR